MDFLDPSTDIPGCGVLFTQSGLSFGPHNLTMVNAGNNPHEELQIDHFMYFISCLQFTLSSCDQELNNRSVTRPGEAPPALSSILPSPTTHMCPLATFSHAPTGPGLSSQTPTSSGITTPAPSSTGVGISGGGSGKRGLSRNSKLAIAVSLSVGLTTVSIILWYFFGCCGSGRRGRCPSLGGISRRMISIGTLVIVGNVTSANVHRLSSLQSLIQIPLASWEWRRWGCRWCWRNCQLFVWCPSKPP